MLAELPLPYPDRVSELIDARDLVVDEVEKWSAGWRTSATIGHAGIVTPEFLIKQAGKAPRSIISAIRGGSTRFGGGKAVECLVTFHWYFAASGTLEDRATLGLLFSGEGSRLIARSPWFDPADDDNPFERTPVADSINWEQAYHDKDERSGLSVWALVWAQAVGLGSAGRTPDPVGEFLERVEGIISVDGEPNPTTVESLVT